MVLAKAPVAGRVKTRLCPPLSANEAAEVARAALLDTLEAVAGCSATRRILALDGSAGSWIPRGFEVIPQRGTGLAERLAAAWSDAGGHGLQIGMDTPQVTAALLDSCLRATARPGVTASLGLAADGGWWALGLNAAWGNDVFSGVPMSTARTGSEQLASLRAAGHQVAALPILRDVDRIDDATAVATLAPDTRFRRGSQVYGSGGVLTATALTAEPGSCWPSQLFAGPTGVAIGLHLMGAGVVALPVDRWHRTPSTGELDVLSRAVGPVLDVGCGPGRHVVALLRQGRLALGIDNSPAAVAVARRRGAPAVRASVFGDVPGAGGWETALLLDGNIGIGGDPVALLHRLRCVVAPSGGVLAEVEPAHIRPGRFHARVEHAGVIGQAFPWARVGWPQVAGLAAATGYAVEELWESEGRWFAHLRCTSSRAEAA